MNGSSNSEWSLGAVATAAESSASSSRISLSVSPSSLPTTGTEAACWNAASRSTAETLSTAGNSSAVSLSRVSSVAEPFTTGTTASSREDSSSDSSASSSESNPLNPRLGAALATGASWPSRFHIGAPSTTSSTGIDVSTSAGGSAGDAGDAGDEPTTSGSSGPSFQMWFAGASDSEATEVGSSAPLTGATSAHIVSSKSSADAGGVGTDDPAGRSGAKRESKLNSSERP